MVLVIGIPELSYFFQIAICVFVASLAVVGAVAIVQYCTGRKPKPHRDSSKLIVAEDALRASEARFALTVAGASNGLWDWDVRAGTVYYAPRFRELLGLGSDELGNSFDAWQGLLHPQDATATRTALEAHLKDKQPFSHRCRLRCKSGNFRWFDVRGQALWDDSGTATRMAGSIMDISDQIDAEQARESSQLLYLSLVENLPVYLMRKDLAGRFTFANRAFCRLLNKSLDEIRGTTDFDHYPDELAEKYRRDDVQVAETGELFEDIEENIDSSGQHYFEVLKTQVVDGLGTVIGTQAIFWDVTDRKMAENALREAKIAAEQANIAKSEFLANMSHEIRTPMNAIIGMTELVLETQLSSDQREYLIHVMEAGESLLTIINEILDFSKIEAGRMELESHPFELREMLGSALKSLGVRAHKKGIELIWQCQEDVPDWIVGDATRLRQILFNLVGNAIKFTNEGEVLLSVHQRSENEVSVELEFSVADSGIGIEASHHEKIFDAFQQADTSTTRRYGGTGLGLAISRRLIHLMGGEIKVESEIGKGSTFRFQASFGRDASHVGSSVLDTEQFQDTTILVVDDNATNRQILVKMFNAWGLAVHAVETGKAAIEYLKALLQKSPPPPIPILVTDYNMPEMDGCMLCSEVRRLSGLAGIKIIVLSSSVAAAQNEFGAMDISAFLYKPIKQSDLFNALVDTIGSKSKSPIAALPEADSMPPLNVLLAEDGLANQKLAIGLLKRWGHSVTVVENGADAVAAWASGIYDVILMDVQMPVMDGLEAAKSIRTRESESNSKSRIPIIAVTAHAMTGDREKCLAAGMDSYVTKPFKKQALYEALRPLVQK